jgi:hypothetical protein
MNMNMNRINNQHCNDWGWFVDFEEVEEIKHKKKHYVNTLETIDEEYEYYINIKVELKNKNKKDISENTKYIKYVKEHMVVICNTLFNCIYGIYLCITPIIKLK